VGTGTAEKYKVRGQGPIPIINQEIFNVAKIAIGHLSACHTTSGNDLWKRNVFRRWRKTGSEGDDWKSTGSVFQSMAAATGKERRPTVDERNGGTCS